MLFLKAEFSWALPQVLQGIQSFSEGNLLVWKSCGNWMISFIGSSSVDFFHLTRDKLFSI
jgi:hypothetical protein